jgi:hypothetical protein
MSKRELAKMAPVDLPADQQQAPAVPIARDDPIVVQLFHATWLPKGASTQERYASLAHAYGLLQKLRPRDAEEMMLASQMVAAHGAAMESMRRAMLPDQPLVVTDSEFKKAEKWMTLFRKHMAALDKHRSKGQQQVTVKRIYYMGDGAQAVFGNVADNRRTLQDEFQPPRDITPARRRPPGEVLPSNENKQGYSDDDV